MKNWKNLSFVLFLFLITGTACTSLRDAPKASGDYAGQEIKEKKIRVACVGDSITFGFGILFGEAYPRILQGLLGPGFEVENFGLNSATLLSKGDLPYRASSNYAESLAFEPDIVLLCLGTNDTKDVNYQFFADFSEDYRSLLESYLNLDSKPQVLLAFPPWTPGNRLWGINEKVLEEERPLIQNLAQDYQLAVVDLHEATKDQSDLFLLDKVHPNAQGAKVLAQEFFKALQGILNKDDA